MLFVQCQSSAARFDSNIGAGQAAKMGGTRRDNPVANGEETKKDAIDAGMRSIDHCKDLLRALVGDGQADRCCRQESIATMALRFAPKSAAVYQMGDPLPSLDTRKVQDASFG